MLDEYPDVLNTDEVISILSISRNLLYQLINSGELPAMRVGSKIWRIRKDNLIQYLQQ